MPAIDHYQPEEKIDKWNQESSLEKLENAIKTRMISKKYYN